MTATLDGSFATQGVGAKRAPPFGLQSPFPFAVGRPTRLRRVDNEPGIGDAGQTVFHYPTGRSSAGAVRNSLVVHKTDGRWHCGHHHHSNGGVFCLFFFFFGCRCSCVVRILFFVVVTDSFTSCVLCHLILLFGGNFLLFLLVASHLSYHLEELRFALASPFLFNLLLEEDEITILGSLDVHQFICLLYPFDALLEQRSDLSLAQAVHQLLGRVVRRQQLDAVDEPVQFLRRIQTALIALVNWCVYVCFILD